MDTPDDYRWGIELSTNHRELFHLDAAIAAQKRKRTARDLPRHGSIWYVLPPENNVGPWTWTLRTDTVWLQHPTFAIFAQPRTGQKLTPR